MSMLLYSDYHDLITKANNIIPLPKRGFVNDKEYPILYRTRIDGRNAEIRAYTVHDTNDPALNDKAIAHISTEAERNIGMWWFGHNEILYPEIYVTEKPRFTQKEKEKGPFSWANSIVETTRLDSFWVFRDNPVFSLDLDIFDIAIHQRTIQPKIVSLAEAALSDTHGRTQ